MNTLKTTTPYTEFSGDLLEAMEDMVLVKDRESRIVWANKAFLDYYGMSLEELISMVDSEKSDPKDTIQYLHDDNYVVVNKKALNIEAELVTSGDGRQEYFNTIKTPVLENGEVKYIVAVARSVKDKNIIESADKERKTRHQGISEFQAFTRALPSAVIMLDMQGRIIAHSKLWGQVVHGEVQELEVGSYFHEHYSTGHELNELYERRDNGKVVSFKSYELKLEGDRFIYADITISPWSFENMDTGGHLIKLYDVTRAFIDEKKIEELHKRLKLALEASDVGVWDWKVDTDELIWDDQMHRLYGISKEDFKGGVNDYMTALTAESLPAVETAFKKVYEEHAKFDTAFGVKLPGGKVRHLRALAQVEFGDDGKLARMIGVNWDITKSKNLEEQLKRSNDELTQFAYRTSHDLRAPLLNTKGLAEFAIEDIESGDTEEAVKNLKKIMKVTSQLEQLIEDLLTLCKLDEMEIDEQLKEVAIEKKVETIEEKFGHLMDSAQVELIKEFKHDVPLISNGVKMQQILENLISNGIKYSKKDDAIRSYVKIRTEDDEDEFIIYVEDNGMGIPRNRQRSVFSMFQRHHPNVSFGSGLGLYLVKKNVEYLGGNIHFTSSEEGTIWRVKLPLRKSNDA